MSSQPDPVGSKLVGYQCTNKKCLRIFTTSESLRRHKIHRSQIGKPCAHPKCGAKLFEVPVRGIGLRHTKTISVPLYSGDFSSHLLVYDRCAFLICSRRRFWRRRKSGGAAKPPHFLIFNMIFFNFCNFKMYA